jgi:hypothetical protein
LTRALSIGDGFTVQVHHRTRAEIEGLVRRMNGMSDDDAAKASAEFYLAGWSGCTPAACARLGVMLDEDQPLSGGEVPFDTEVARDLWRHAFPDEFMNKVIRFSRLILEAVDEEKRRAKNVSSAL